MAEQKLTIKKIVLEKPSQQMLKWIEGEQAAGKDVSPYTVTLSVELAILDKLDEILIALSKPVFTETSVPSVTK